MNERWLRTGEGDMWQEDDDALLDRLAKKHRLSVRQQSIVRNFLELPEDRREALLDLLGAILPQQEAATSVDDDLPQAIKDDLAARQAQAENARDA